MRYATSPSRAMPAPGSLDASAKPVGIEPIQASAALPSRRMVAALAALGLCLAVAWLPVHLTMPLGRDQAMLGLVAERMLEGYWPYAESWDHRGPVAYALFAAMTWICGDIPTGIVFGDVAFATNPFEYYLDYGIQIKARSPAPQTFLVQLAGAGTYVPSPRSTLGGGYGSLPASNPVGAEGGGVLRDRTVELLREYWK